MPKYEAEVVGSVVAFARVVEKKVSFTNKLKKLILLNLCDDNNSKKPSWGWFMIGFAVGAVVGLIIWLFITRHIKED